MPKKIKGDSVVFQTEKAMKDYGDKVSQEERSKIEQALSDLKEALKGDDAARMKAATDAALQASQKLGEAMYKAQQGAANAQAGAAGAQQAGPQPSAEQAQASGNKDDVVEAEVVDK